MKDYTEIFSKAYVYEKRVIDESVFLNNGDFSFDDVRFELILDRLETGHSCYIDVSDFMFKDIQNE